MVTKFKELSYQRTFNLGNYESERIAVTVELDDPVNLKEAFRKLKRVVFELHDTPVDERIEKIRDQIGRVRGDARDQAEKNL